ncbi:hypothetical protein [Flavobacterium subsaxonicum]|uniref:Uncharacterized protein n=1 Tax=Flavobacterium subsaxonicum WB 4.1-42 = DSM 21790 TaxID=1121898 RepID=A0A0A2MIR9_9FLAO|nr:hypothetical protein [Flavobacterium subsaxonicum]KGO92537.1 hypothetical protein Q766_12205 [Flavobacterium subsaxonicum WB 4.1-42 = DSM 21790]
MQDLLDEDEFLAPKPEPAPWKYLTVFCLIALAQVMALFVAIRFFPDAIKEGDEMLAALTVIILPLVTIFTMFFGRRKNRYLPKKIIALFILILLGFYFVTIMSISVAVGSATVSTIFIIMGSFMAYFVLCCVIILPIANAIQKRAKLNRI